MLKLSDNKLSMYIEVWRSERWLGVDCSVKTQKFGKQATGALVTFHIQLGLSGQMMKGSMLVLMSLDVKITEGKWIELFVSLEDSLVDIKIISGCHLS